MNYTTVEQSKKFLDMGLDPDTASMCYYSTMDVKPEPLLKEFHKPSDGFEILPCWTLEDLIDLLPKQLTIDQKGPECMTITYTDVIYNGVAVFNSGETLFNNVERSVEWMLCNGHIKKKSSLEKVELLDWMRGWELKETLVYKNSAENQAIWVRDKIAQGLLKCKCFVVSTHVSKACKLPVYYLKLRNGIKVIMRNNFYDWKVSVEIPESYDNLRVGYMPLDCIMNPGEDILSCYCEGFKKEWVYGKFDVESPNKKFTVQVHESEELYVLLRSLNYAYPDKAFDVEADTRTIEEIRDSIEKIVYQHNDMFCNEVFWMTRHAVVTVPTVNDHYELAELIMQRPEMHREFLMEEWLYQD